MRVIIDTLVALMLAAVLGGVILLDRQKEADDLSVEETRDAVQAIEEQITIQRALGVVELNEKGFPKSISPEWFKLHVPRNALAEGEAPWLEIAGPRDRDLEHPKVWTLNEGRVASFWYNPYNGIVRARVPLGLSEETTLQLYNSVNGTTMPGRAFHPAP